MKWKYKIALKDLLDSEDESASYVNKIKAEFTTRIKTLATNIRSASVKKALERAAEDFEAVPEDENLDEFNDTLDEFYDLADSIALWVE